MRRTAGLLMVVALVAGACSSSDDGGAEAGATASSTQPPEAGSTPPSIAASATTEAVVSEPVVPAEVTGPVSDGDGIVLPQPAVPPPDDYITEEFFLGGSADSYQAVGETGADGVWEAEVSDSADYRTRVIVNRPPADRFSGTVLVEWLNVSAVEASPDWAYLVEEVGRSGHAYVMVSAQSQGVMGGDTILDVEVDEEAASEAGAVGEVSEGGLVNVDPARYGELTHPGDAYSFDLYSEVGAAVRAESDVILGGLEPTQLIAVGESQSAFFLTTYINAVHPMVGVYDGFMVHSRGGSAAPLGGDLIGDGDDPDDAEARGEALNEGVLIRTDLDVPVFTFEAETDLTRLGFASARQPDTDLLRTWEVAGTAHADAHTIGALLGADRDSSLGSILGCDTPINTGPHHEVYQAALSHLVAWIDGGPPPPSGQPIELDGTGADTVVVRDELGHALGGVRNPLVDVPVAVVSGDPPASEAEEFGVCGLFGTTVHLDAAQLAELHGTADAYVESFTTAAESAVAAGFLLQPDADNLIAEAEANRVLFDI